MFEANKTLSLAAVALMGSVALFTASPALAGDFGEPVVKEVTEDTFIRSEVDARLLSFQQSGGMNRGVFFAVPTPTDHQVVPRMNRDTLYSGIPVDTSKGFSVTLPEVPDERYASIYIIDQDHYTVDILSVPGTYHFGPQDTRWVVAIPRIQVRDPNDQTDIKIARNILRQVHVDSGSAEPLDVSWDWAKMLEMRAEYEAKARAFTQYPPTWQDTRASEATTPEHHRIAVASSWGLFPDYETVYILQPSPSGTNASEVCYTANYEVPEHEHFWSITMYDSEGYMFSDDRAVLNDGTAEMNSDGTFTTYYGSKGACGDVPNRMDTVDNFSILMRVYGPTPSVSAGEYTLPEMTLVN
ncbi:DUF1214 domain-containing protein [Shimia sagamensis]|uniref:DUF1214 domain-containing protein n=1 Tax=Shimia sagamensis TaxID=1566352 RepID=A0ABY1NRK3_9RHOB|nr:DUF1214 domain-containing protein [Shimia sagamensis]SMP16518.1 Protein of unknown function [Shimia sagamensis]